MKIIRVRKKRPSMPPGHRPPPSASEDSDALPPEADRSSYEEMRVEFAILRHIAHTPGGATIPALAIALKLKREDVERAVNTLAREEIVSVTASGKVILGPPSKHEAAG